MGKLRTWRLAVLLAGGMSATAFASERGAVESRRPYTMALDALVGSDGTDVVFQIASTGGQTLPAQIEHILLWATSTNGRVLGARFATDIPLVDGRAVVTGLSIPVHTSLSAVLTVRVAGSRRIQVLSASGRALYRPDLRIAYVSAPSEVRVGQLVNVDVVVLESLGHRGAAFDLVLLEGATVLDQVSGATVDAAGTATAVFTVRFDTAGLHALTARVVNVRPGEYDLSNNDASFEIRVTDLLPAAYTLNYRRFEGEYSENFDSSFTNFKTIPGASGPNTTWHGSRYLEIGRREILNYVSSSDQFVGGVINFDTTIVVDGRDAARYTLSGWAPSWSGGDAEMAHAFYQAYDPETDTTVSVQSNWSASRGSQTTLTFSRKAGDYTYYSASYEQFWAAIGIQDPVLAVHVWSTDSHDNTTGESGTVRTGTFLDVYRSIQMHTTLLTDGASIGGWTAGIPIIYSAVDRTWDETSDDGSQTLHLWGYERRSYWDANGVGVTTP